MKNIEVLPRPKGVNDVEHELIIHLADQILQDLEEHKISDILSALLTAIAGVMEYQSDSDRKITLDALEEYVGYLVANSKPEGAQH